MATISVSTNVTKRNEVNQRLVILHSLKQHRFPLYWEYRNKYKQRNLNNLTEDGYTNYGMNTQYAIINTKASELLANTLKYDFVALDEEAQRYRRVRQLHWDYVWQVSQTDNAIYTIVFDALKYGIGVGKEVWTCDKRNIQEPTLTEDGITFTEKEVTDYEGCKLNYIPWKNVWLNGRNIEQTTEAAVVTYFDRAKFFEVFGNNKMFSGVEESRIPKGKYYYVPENNGELTIAGSPWNTDQGDNNVQNPDIVSVLEYWNKYKDEYVVMANGEWINALPNGKVMPNPNPSKEIPLVVYTDIYLEDDIYGMGEFDITSRSSAAKDESRSLGFEVIKAQGGIITISPDSEFDDAVMELGIRKYARVEKDAFGFFAPNINSNSLQEMEQRINEDLIIESGIDFRSQLLSPNETATKTEGKIQAALKRINLSIKYNAYTFYERLARLRLANMEFYKDKTMTIPVRGIDVDGKGNVTNLAWGYGLFTMKPEYFSGKLNLLPRIDSMTGTPSSEVKQKYMEVLQLLLNLVDRDSGKPLYDPKSLIEAGRGIIDEVIDLDKISEKKVTTKTPSQILDEVDNVANGQPNAPTMDEGFIPAAQRSGKPILLPSSPNQA